MVAEVVTTYPLEQTVETVALAAAAAALELATVLAARLLLVKVLLVATVLEILLYRLAVVVEVRVKQEIPMGMGKVEMALQTVLAALQLHMRAVAAAQATTYQLDMLVAMAAAVLARGRA